MAITQLITAEQFADLPDIPGKQLELVHGEVIEMPPPGLMHNLIAGLIYQMLATFASEQDIALVFGDNAVYLLSQAPDTMRIPDVSASYRAPD